MLKQMSTAIKSIPEGLGWNLSNWSCFYTGHYLPAGSCFTDCACSRDGGPYGTALRRPLDSTVWTMFLWRGTDYYRVLQHSCQGGKRLPLYKDGTGSLPPHTGPRVAFHVLQTVQHRDVVYYDAKLPLWDAITTLWISCYVAFTAAAAQSRVIPVYVRRLTASPFLINRLLLSLGSSSVWCLTNVCRNV